MVNDWSRRIALLASAVHPPEEPKKEDEGRACANRANPFKRRRKRNQQDRFHSYGETHRHPSLNKD